MKIGVLADAHGNLPGFLSGLKCLRDRGAQAFLYLGDACGYVPSTDVVDLHAELAELDNWHFIAGNHDFAAIQRGTDSQSDEVTLITWFRENLSERARQHIASLPHSLDLTIDGTRILAVHGTPQDPLYGYAHSPSDVGLVDGMQVLCVAATHRPYIADRDGVLVVNPGSCGLPRDDGSLGSVALLESATREVQVLRYRLDWGPIASDERVHESVKALSSRRSSSTMGSVVR
jgi:putative phosphoesterase